MSELRLGFRRRGATLVAMTAIAACFAGGTAMAQPEVPPAQRRVIPPPEADIVVTGQRPEPEILVRGRNASDTWLRAESRHFIVYSDASEAALKRQVQRLEQFDAFLRSFMRIPDPVPPNKLEIYSVDGMSLLSRIANESQGMIHDSKEHDLGHLFYRASPTAMILGVNREYAIATGMGATDDWLLHEYTHHVMLQQEPLTLVPSWYFEGMAFYMAGTEVEADRIDLGIPPTEAGRYLGRGDKLRYRDLVLRDDWHLLLGRPNGDPRPTTFLVESWLMVHYFLADPARRSALQNLMRDLRREADKGTAMQTALGFSMDDLEARLKSHAARLPGARFTLNPAAPAPEVQVKLLPRSADAMLIPYAAMRRGISDERTRAATLSRIRRAAAQYQDRFSRRALAFAEIHLGDPARAEVPLQQLLNAIPNDAELLYLMGLRHLAGGRSLQGAARPSAYREAQRWFQRAYSTDPDHYPTLFRYAETLLDEPGFPSQNMRNLLVEAVDLAPQVGHVRLAAAHVLLLRGETDLARQILQTMLVSTHNPHAVEAEALLKLIAAGGKPSRPQLEQVFAAH